MCSPASASTTVVRHPVAQHTLGLMRRADNSTKTSRELSAEVATLLTYEAPADLETARRLLAKA